MTAIRAITRVQDADDVTLAGAANNDPIVYDSSTGGMKKGAAGSADKLGLTPTAVKTTGYSAAAGDFVPVDTSSGAVTVTLPSAPADGTVISVKHVIQGTTNPVSVTCGGSDVINKAAGATTVTLPYVGQSVVLQYKSSSAIWYVVARDDAPLISEIGVGLYGDGSDGVCAFDGSTTYNAFSSLASSVYTLSRDVYLADGSSISNNVQIKTNGFRLFCNGTLTGGGSGSIIQFNGKDAAVNVAGSSQGNGSGTYIQSATVGTAGGAGGTAAGTAGSNNATQGYGGVGGTGGTGTSGAGAAGGTIASVATSREGLRALPLAALGLGVTGTSGLFALGGGSGGGGGGGDGTNPGGGGGGGAAPVVVCVKTFAGTGAIRSRGGAGGTNTVGNVGGGAGGGGGWVVVISQSVVGGAVAGWTIDANGGAAGSPHGTGTNNASAGSNGATFILPG